MDGSIYQASVPWLAHDSLLLIFSWKTSLVPSGTIGVLLKSKFTNMDAYADSDGLCLADLNKFNVMFNCDSSWPHYLEGNLGQKCIISLYADLYRCEWQVPPHYTGVCVVIPVDIPPVLPWRCSSCCRNICCRECGCLVFHHAPWAAHMPFSILGICPSYYDFWLKHYAWYSYRNDKIQRCICGPWRMW